MVPANPFSRVADGSGWMYLACLLERRPAEAPELTDELRAEIRADLTQRRAEALAMEAARAAYERLQEALEAGTPFSEAKGDLPFEAIPPFPATVPYPQFARFMRPKHEAGDALRELALDTPAGSVAAPQKMAAGAYLMYVKSQNFPEAAEYEERVEGRLENNLREQYAALTRVTWERYLEEERPAMLQGPWRVLAPEEQQPRPQGTN